MSKHVCKFPGGSSGAGEWCKEYCPFYGSGRCKWDPETGHMIITLPDQQTQLEVGVMPGTHSCWKCACLDKTLHVHPITRLCYYRCCCKKEQIDVGRVDSFSCERWRRIE